MPQRAFHTESSGVAEQIIGFVRFLRSRGLNVGIQESLEALQIAQDGLIQDQKRFCYALKCLFCCQEEEAEIFDQLFAEYWRLDGAFAWDRKKKRTERFTRSVPSSLVLMGRKQLGMETEEEEDSRPTSGANASERLQKTDFSKLTLVETEWLEELAEKLWQQMSRRLKRKRKASRKGQVDLRQTIRKSISKGGDPSELALRKKKPQKQRLVILLDVSGSMDKYSFFLLRF
ncbi:MAG: VWA domain-containing protein, partial [Bacteroidota bacterium]